MREGINFILGNVDICYPSTIVEKTTLSSLNCLSILVGNLLTINIEISGLLVNLYVYSYASKTTLSGLL